MKANAQPLNEILFSNSQFVVPFFQRSYSWDRENWERLGNDIQSLLADDPAKKHFLGPLVCALLSAVPGKTPQYQLIDGQQRLTTLSLLLTAIRDEAKKAGDAELAAEIEVQYLVNQFKKGTDRYKLVPRTGDRELFSSLIEGKDAQDENTRLIGAHDFFRKFIRTHAYQNATYLRQLFDTVVSRLYLVAITLDEEDPYEIFESLNSTGLPLQESDLIRNFLFMQIPLDEQDEFQEEHWAPFESEFELVAGKPMISPTGFYRDFLMRHGEYSKAKETFADFKKYYDAQELKPAAALSQLRRFLGFAKIIANQGEGEPAEVQKVIRQFVWMDASTAIPVVLNLLAKRDTGDLTDDEFVGCIADLNSFILRRTVCGESTRAYGRWFCELAGQLKGDIRERLQGYLLHRGWPDDETFQRSALDFPVYRREFKKCRIILESLERFDGHKELVDLEKIQIEHVMPQKLPSGKAGKEWRDMLGDEFKKIHNRWLHAIGNLTLTGYNQTLGNKAFSDKRKELAESKLSLNKTFETADTWDADRIIARGKKLAEQLSEIWPRPASEVKYKPPAKAASAGEKARERRKRYWAAFNSLLETSSAKSRPTRDCDGTICEIFLPMADVGLYARFLAPKKQLILQLRFSRGRGREIYRGLDADREAIEQSVLVPTTWEGGANPTITATKTGVYIRDRYDWLEHHSWLVDALTQFESGIFGRLRSLHEAVKEKSPSKQFFLEYWIGFHRAMFEKRCQLLATTPLPQYWNDLAIGRSGVWMSAGINRNTSQLVVSLLMGSKCSRPFFPQLEAQKEGIESELGQAVNWNKPEKLKQWRIDLIKEGVDIDNKDDWPNQHDWLVENLIKFDSVFRDRVQKLNMPKPLGENESPA